MSRTRYACTFCDKEYDTEIEAQACEVPGRPAPIAPGILIAGSMSGDPSERLGYMLVLQSLAVGHQQLLTGWTFDSFGRVQDRGSSPTLSLPNTNGWPRPVPPETKALRRILQVILSEDLPIAGVATLGGVVAFPEWLAMHQPWFARQTRLVVGRMLRALSLCATNRPEALPATAVVPGLPIPIQVAVDFLQASGVDLRGLDFTFDPVRSTALAFARWSTAQGSQLNFSLGDPIVLDEGSEEEDAEEMEDEEDDAVPGNPSLSDVLSTVEVSEPIFSDTDPRFSAD